MTNNVPTSQCIFTIVILWMHRFNNMIILQLYRNIAIKFISLCSINFNSLKQRLEKQLNNTGLEDSLIKTSPGLSLLRNTPGL